MSDEGCANCAALQARVAQLERENAQLRAYISYLLAIIGKAQQFVRRVIYNADKAMSDHLPRGTWSRWVGRKETSERVQAILSGKAL